MTELVERCRQMFEAHRRFGFGGSFHVPDVTAYPELFAWDSGYHALALRHLDLDLAIEELRTLYRANQSDDGLLAHQRPLPDDPQRVEAVTRDFGPLYRDSGASWLIDPPVAAFAAASLARVSVGAADLLERATWHLDAISGRRILSDAVLPVILHPFESGTEGSPLTDPLLDMSSPLTYVADLRTLMESAAACGFDPQAALEAGHGFVVEDPVMCGWYLLALEETAAAWASRGDPREAARLAGRADATARGLRDRLWWDAADIVAGYDVQAGRPLQAVTASGLIAAASRTLGDDPTTKRTLDRHLRPDTSPLWGPRGISFNPIDPTRSPGESWYWRGNVTWAATHYWAHAALRRAGRTVEARHARRQLETLVHHEGFREYYDPVTGEGNGAGLDRGFTWPTLVLDMRANEDLAP